jgi:hypothetical protein
MVLNNMATQLEEGGLGMMRVISIQEAQGKWTQMN